MADEDLIDFEEARPAGLHGLRLPAFWVDKPVITHIVGPFILTYHDVTERKHDYFYTVFTVILW
jgi:hypothetical protein